MTNKVAYCRNDTGKAECRISGTRPVVPSLLRIDAVTTITAFYRVLLSASCEPNDRRDAAVVTKRCGQTRRPLMESGYTLIDV